jgi:hypothetical protein
MLISRSRIAFTLVAMALAACSSAPPDSPLQGEVNPTPTNKKKNNNSTTKNDDSEGQSLESGTTQQADPTDPANPSAPATPSTPAPTNGQCSGQQTFDTCMQCCDQAFPGGFEVDANAFGQCACESPGVCAQACAGNFCAGGQATAACEQCLNAATQCNTAAETTCNANASCKGVFTCLDTSGCEAKP